MIFSRTPNAPVSEREKREKFFDPLDQVYYISVSWTPFMQIDNDRCTSHKSVKMVVSSRQAGSPIRGNQRRCNVLDTHLLSCWLKLGIQFYPLVVRCQLQALQALLQPRQFPYVLTEALNLPCRKMVKYSHIPINDHTSGCWFSFNGYMQTELPTSVTQEHIFGVFCQRICQNSNWSLRSSYLTSTGFEEHPWHYVDMLGVSQRCQWRTFRQVIGMFKTHENGRT